MESYPGELLVGVFPLVFCVDATLTSRGTAEQSTGDNDNTASSTRGQFDRFLDAMAASLLDEPSGGLFTSNGNPAKKRTIDDHMMNLFRGEDGVLDSDQEDDMILGGDLAGVTMTALGPGSFPDGSMHGEMDPKRTRSFQNVSFPRLARDGNMGGPGANRTSTLKSPSKDGSIGNPSGLDTSFARTLQEGQGFFQRARIVSISSRHGFPPSKDPVGSDNRIQDYFLGKTLRTKVILAATKRRPIDGILPSGWLEKHAAALPSVILVVVEVSSHQRQHEQDVILRETIQSMQMSLASKRQCTIRIVGLVQKEISTSMATEWKQKTSESLEDNPSVTLLDIADLKQDAPSMTLETLHKTVHDASFQYYMTQARRSKLKLLELGPARGTPLFLPLCIRYCFKLAMFYEFLWNPEKSLRYMMEAYRHVETYYRYLLQQRGIATKSSSVTDSTKTAKVRLSSSANSAIIDAESEGVEMSLQNEDDVNNLLLKPPSIPDDMVHQCRVIADWLNFKILQAGFTSHTDSGVFAAATQWQKHVHSFCNPTQNFVCSPDHAYVDWSFVAHQRMVFSQLLERNPPRAVGEPGDENDELFLRCSPSRAYEGAAGALLRLGAEARKAASVGASKNMIVDKMRSRYVGGLDKSGFQPKLQEELKVNHRERALDCLRRAISFYERDIQKMQNDETYADFPPTSHRGGARMYYLTGGTLLGLKRYHEAVPYLEKAIEAAKGWKDLVRPIRKMLIQCYEKQVGAEGSEEKKQSLLSHLLDSYFNGEMTNEDFCRALENSACTNSEEKIKWQCEWYDGAEESSLPFSFALTFPHGTHATAGDTVEASLSIRSNLAIPVNVNSMTLLTSVGEVPIELKDLTKNTGRDPEGERIRVESRAEFRASTAIKLPKEFDENVDESTSKATEKRTSTNSALLQKSVRPRAGGITSAAGARLVPEDAFGAEDPGPEKTRWNLKCLGGKSMKCEGISMIISPLSVDRETQKKTKIELVIEKTKARTPAAVKRTPFEEESYIVSSWARPAYVPLRLGPTCLRMLPPLPDMVITNITGSFTNGKVLEGTVNRILLKLQAGQQEICKNVAIKLSCSSSLVSTTGKTTKIAAAQEGDEEEACFIDPTNLNARTPVLLREDGNASAQMTKYGYEIPAGWALASEDGQATEEGNFLPVIPALEFGNETFIAFDIYRPSPPVTTMEGAYHLGDDEEGLAYEHSLCKSDIDITISYQQSRRLKAKNGTSTKDTPESSALGSDLVNLTQTLSVQWSDPLSATFAPGVRITHPSGNRHPTNVLPDPSTRRSPIAVSTESELVLVDKERVTVKCILESAASTDGLMADVEEIRFENVQSENSPCEFKLLSGKNKSGMLYKAAQNDPCRKLIYGSKFSLAWTCEVNMKSNYLKGSVSASLGTLSIDWSPNPLEIPAEVKGKVHGDPITKHGPLRMARPSTCRFKGPPCYIENAPFETSMERLPDKLEIATPFQIVYHVKNKTSLDQKLSVSLKGIGTEASDGFMMAGFIKGEISLGPFETHTFTYTALATRSGMIEIPPVCISSDRYKTWLVQEPGQSRMLFIAP